MGVKVSIILPTYLRPRLLHRCLKALVAQNGWSPADYEILVVDDGRSPDTEAQVLMAGRQ
ncbi:MAG: glycosyltransferase, partial [Zoogloea sp.]|nr:glycosyltransferase [Zoogloea sp.]